MRSPISTRDDSDRHDADLPPAMDVQDALSRLGNDAELLTAIIQIYLEDAPGLLERIKTAVANKDASALQRAAHSLKGLAATLSAADVTCGASRLEHMGGSCSLHGAEAPLEELEHAARELEAMLKQRWETS